MASRDLGNDGGITTVWEAMMSNTTTYLVYTNAAEGRDDEFNTWYDTVHIPEILAMFPSVVSAKRFSAADPAAEHAYLAMYEIEGDADATIRAIGKAMMSGELTTTDSMDAPRSARAVWVAR